ncbi:MAG: LCP family protein [Eubacteriales bacterium]|nr:LCP family protein [Eubacteriales bacterium]
MYKTKRWLPIALAAVFLQVSLGIFAIYYLDLLNMLPDDYLLLAAGTIIILFLFTTWLMFSGLNKRPGIGRRIRRGIGLFLALVMAFGSIGVAAVAFRVTETVQAVTSADMDVQTTIGVYVRKASPAVKLRDTAAFAFGVIANVDRENTEQAVEAIDGDLNQSITVVPMGSMMDCAGALYEGKVQALILDEAYAEILADTEEYKDFKTNTRMVYEVPIVSAAAEDAEEEKAAGGLQADAASTITEEPFIMYISGSDTRNKKLVKGRSDVNILMVMNPKTRQVLLLNTPRDFYVKNPAGNNEMDKLTHCGLYGIDNSIQTLEQLYGIEIGYYSQINFTGFETLIDAIGGITVYSSYEFDAWTDHYSFVEGENKMNGKQALAFARERYSLPAGDNDRGKNEMRVITAIMNKVTSGSPKILMNYNEIMDSLEGMFATNLKPNDISALVRMQIDDMAEWDIKSFAVTGEGGSDASYSMQGGYSYVTYPNTARVKRAASLIEKVMNGENLTTADVV